MTVDLSLVESFVRLRVDASDAFDSLPGYPVRAVDGYEDLLGSLCSWGRYIQRGLTVLEAVDSLPDARLFSPPLRRSLIEHAVTLAAVADEPTLYAVQQRKMQKGADRVRKATEDIGLEVPSDLSDALSWDAGDEDKGQDSLGNFAPLCRSLGPMGASYYLGWLQETQLAHVSMLTSVAYLLPGENGGAPMLTMDSQQSARDVLRDSAGAADMMILAVDKISQVLHDDPLRQSVDDLNRRKSQLLLGAGVR